MDKRSNDLAKFKDVFGFVEAIEDAWRREFDESGALSVSLFTRVLIISRMEGAFWKSMLGGSQRNMAEHYVMAMLHALGPMTPGALNVAQMQTSGGLAKTLVRLESAGFISRTVVPEDRRSVQIQLTATGTRVAKRMINGLHKAMNKKTARFSEVKLRKANQTLDDVLRVFLD